MAGVVAGAASTSWTPRLVHRSAGRLPLGRARTSKVHPALRRAPSMTPACEPSTPHYRHMVASAAAPAAQQGCEGLAGFEDRTLSEFNIAVIGDLHLDPDAMEPFLAARDQFRRSMALPGVAHSSADASNAAATPAFQPGARVVQLGDLGSYHHGPGGWGCFLRAKEYLDGFGVAAATILGNHDLEGAEFETDGENLEAWQQIFGQPHYWSQDVGPMTLIGLSTTRFRDNPDSVHEVHIDDEQLDFLERALQAAGSRPVAIFTHAPVMGSGLKVVQQVHVKNRCAWLNHSSDPTRFLRLLAAHPNVRLWFSGHFHLSHNYADSISVVGGCAFVQVGVIGECHRDGFRQSRVLKGDAEGYGLYTMDHETGALRLDLEHSWADPSGPRPLTPPDELICDPSAGWLCSKIDCSLDAEATKEGMAAAGVQWFAAGGNCLLAFQGDILVEYDAAMMAPIGAVALNIPDGCQVVLVDGEGREVDAVGTNGSAAVAVELRLPLDGGDGNGANGSNGSNGSGSSNYAVHERIERNSRGTFFQIFQKNKWWARKEKEAREAAEAAARAAQQQQQQQPVR